MAESPCEDCHFDVPASANACPHCGRPGRFPNVRAAQQTENQRALDERYDAALRALDSHGAKRVGEAFEAAIRDRSEAVIARPLHELDRLASSDRQGYASFYELVEAGVRIPEDQGWDVWRRVADPLFFPNYESHIRFAALTLDGRGLPHYGDGFIVLRDDMIAHRASVCESNSAAIVRQEGLRPDTAPAALRGRTAVWSMRGRLAAAKHSSELTAGIAESDYAAIVQRPGASGGADDVFIEVHIYGSLTVRSFSRVVLQRSRVRSQSIRRALSERLNKYGIKMEVVA